MNKTETANPNRSETMDMFKAFDKWWTERVSRMGDKAGCKDAYMACFVAAWAGALASK